MVGPTSGMERIARIPRLQSDLWETNAGYKITLPIQIGKLMVAFVDSLFGPARQWRLAELLSWNGTKFRERRFSQIFTPGSRCPRQFSASAWIFLPIITGTGVFIFFFFLSSRKLKINPINIIFSKCLVPLNSKDWSACLGFETII